MHSGGGGACCAHRRPVSRRGARQRVVAHRRPVSRHGARQRVVAHRCPVSRHGARQRMTSPPDRVGPGGHQTGAVAPQMAPHPLRNAYGPSEEGP